MIGAVLSGGENRRMPHLKGLLTVEGVTIIERCLGVLGDVFGKVVISTNSPETYFRFAVPLVGDVRRERGPLTGIFSVLAATGEEAVFVVGCDMPFISGELMRYMVREYREQAGSRKVDAVVPVFQDKTEPLFAIYARSCLKAMEEILSSGGNGINEMLRRVHALHIDETEVRRRDPEGRSFVNINTMEDYEKIGGALCSA